MRCGHCKTVGPAITVAHVRQCSKGGVAVLDHPDAQDKAAYAAREQEQERAAYADKIRREEQANPWSEANALRAKISEHLVRKVGVNLVGYYAARLYDDRKGAEVVKFYRIKKVPNGRVFVDVQASDDYWPVRSPAALKLVLDAIVKDPDKAALLYATELNRCCRCGRTLTDETSRAMGMGPECRSK